MAHRLELIDEPFKYCRWVSRAFPGSRLLSTPLARYRQSGSPPLTSIDGSGAICYLPRPATLRNSDADGYLLFWANLRRAQTL